MSNMGEGESVKEYIFDCWYRDDGTPNRKIIAASNKRVAIEKFEWLFPEMDYDEPYRRI
mgnify:CR=1 FL=1